MLPEKTFPFLEIIYRVFKNERWKKDSISINKYLAINFESFDNKDRILANNQR